MQEVLLVATRASTIQSLVDTLQFAGIETFAIKITSLAAWNLLGPKLEGYTQSIGVVDIRDTISELSFFLDGTFRMARSVELGYNSIIAKIAQLLGVGVAEAEEYLRTEPVDLTLSEEEIDPTEDNRLREAVMAVFTSFVTELVRSIRYYESQAARTDRVGKLMIFGNIRYFKNLTPFLERETGLEISEVSLSSLVQYQQGVYALDVLHAHAEKLIVAAGLCVDFFRKGRIEFNLLPSVYYVKAQAWNVLKIGVVLLLIVAAFIYYQYNVLVDRETEANSELAAVTAEKAKWEPTANKFEQVKSEIASKKPKFNQIYALVKSQLMWPPIMEELGKRIPDTCFLEEVAFDASGKTIEMSGVAVDRLDLMQFAISLDMSDFFTGTEVKEETEAVTSGGGGIGAGGGGGGGGGASLGGASARTPRGYSSGSSPGGSGQSVIIPRGHRWDSREGLANENFVESMPVDFELPRLGLGAGRSIEDYFQREMQFVTPYIFRFDITTKLQEGALVQEEAVSSLTVLEEVTRDVLNT